MAMEKEPLWQNRDIRFDVDQRMLRLVPGEILVDRIDGVEDTKGNNGDKGVMRITNLRIVWHASAMTRINLCIGYSCISGIQSKFIQSKIRGNECEALVILARVRDSSTKFEFIFTASNAQQHTRIFNTLSSILRAYDTTKLYRELKMRGALIDDNENLRLLPLEETCDRVNGVWNLSQDQGNLGVFIITTCRIVWFAQTNIMYNVSVPYLQLFSCRIRDSKFGLALVLETTSSSGEYVLGFRIDPPERLHAVCKMIQALHKAQLTKPIFGVMLVRERPPTPRANEEETIDHMDEESEFEEKQTRTDAFAAYFTEGGPSEGIRPPVFSAELGLAVEQLKPGFTISDLWSIHAE